VTEPKLDLREAMIAARERLGALAERLARARARLDGSGVPRPLSAAGSQPAPFGGADGRPIDDLELTFRAVDVGNVGAVGEAGQHKR
jgi:hypothetical protein